MLYLFAALWLAILVLLLWRDHGRGRKPAPAAPSSSKTPKPREILVDGSNVMWWDGNQPRAETLIAVIELLQDKGYHPGVIFDASAGHKLFGGYRDDDVLAEILGLPETQVLVVPKGEVADRFLLQVAWSRNLSIVSNDRYREWLEDFPDAKAPGKLIRGGWRDGKPWVQL